jgi:hypothetical protein
MEGKVEMKKRFMLLAMLLAGAAVPALAQVVPAPPSEASPPAPVPPEASGMVPADPNVPRNPAAPEGTAANPTVVGGNMTPPPATPKEYPVCTRTITDSCINPGEGPAARKAKARRRR